MLPGSTAIGHDRYSTTGATRWQRPAAVRRVRLGWLRGRAQRQLSNAIGCAALNRRGSIFQSTSDTEVIIHLVATSQLSHAARPDNRRPAADRRRLFAGLLTEEADRLPRSARRAPAGYRPDRRRHVLRHRDRRARRHRRTLRARDRAGRDGRHHRRAACAACGRSPESRPRPCMFEHLFRAGRTASSKDSVYEARKRIGPQLARESDGRADYRRTGTDAASPRPSAMPRSGIPFELGIIRNHYVGRTFIEPSDKSATSALS